MITKGIRFTNGAMVAAKLDQLTLHQTHIELFDAIEFVPFKFADPETGQIIETISMSPFIPISKDSSVMVNTAHILAFTNLHETAERRYLDFIEQMTLRAAQLNRHGVDDLYDDPEADIPDEVLDLFDDLDMTKVQ